jgi:hypothetical protein
MALVDTLTIGTTAIFEMIGNAYAGNNACHTWTTAESCWNRDYKPEAIECDWMNCKGKLSGDAFAGEECLTKFEYDSCVSQTYMDMDKDLKACEWIGPAFDCKPSRISHSGESCYEQCYKEDESGNAELFWWILLEGTKTGGNCNYCGEDGACCRQNFNNADVKRPEGAPDKYAAEACEGKGGGFHHVCVANAKCDAMPSPENCCFKDDCTCKTSQHPTGYSDMALDWSYENS